MSSKWQNEKYNWLFFNKKNETDNNNLLYYLYNGTNINKQLTFYEQANEFDKVRKKMNVIVNKTDEIEGKANKIISKDVICPLCKENALIDLRNLKINLFGCRNNHNINNIPLSRYEEMQQIDLSQIVCNNFDVGIIKIILIIMTFINVLHALKIYALYVNLIMIKIII